MIIPEAGETCQVCGAAATSFHPYNGFCCPVHLREAQAAFSARSERGAFWEPYSELKKQLLEQREKYDNTYKERSGNPG